MTSPPNSVKASTINTLSYEELLSKLESARREFKEFEKGQRKALYQSMQLAAEAASLVKADESIESRYRKKMGENDAVYAALIFIFDAKSREKKKDASKRATALWYLIVKQKVAVEDIAMAIPNHGGIEKLARLAAKSRSDEADEDLDDDDDEDQDKPEKADEDDKTEQKFGKLISVGLSPKLTTKLNQFANKTRIRIIGYVRKFPDELPTIEVKKIIEAAAKKKVNSKAKAAKKKDANSRTKATAEKPDDDASDWE
jgi:hypothetical protein